MGNALHHGDGLTVSGISAVESYSIGMTSESRATTDASTSSSRKWTGTSKSPSRNNQWDRTSNGPPPRHDGKYKDKRDRPAKRYNNNYTGRTDASLSRTDNSSAYHHGYQARNEARDDRENGSYQGGPSYAETDRDDGAYREDEGYEYGYKKNYSSFSDVSSKHSGKRYNQHRPLQQKSADNYLRTQQDSTVDGMSTLGDILPAETDMAYAGSEDEENVQAVRDIELRKNKAKSPTNERVMAGSGDHTKRSNNVSDVTDSKLPCETHSHVNILARSVLEEPPARTLPDDYSDSECMQSDSFSTLTRTVVTLGGNSEVIRKETEVNRNQLKESTVGSDDRRCTPRLEEEQQGEVVVEEEGKVEEGDEEESPGQTQLLDLLKQQQLQEEKLQAQLEQLRIQKGKLLQLQDEKVRARDGDGSHQSGQPASRQGWKLPEINQAQPGDDRTSTAKVSVESSRHERTRRQRLERARQKVMPRSPSKPNGKTQPSKTSSKKASSKKGSACVYSFDDVDKDESPELHVAEVNNFMLEEKYAGQPREPVVDDETTIGTATGEIAGSVPEYEDVPSHCKINQSAHAPFQENDLTTISASVMTNGLPYLSGFPGSSTISSMKDGGAVGNELEPLDEVLSSMEEEIDLDFVAKFDTAFNAFLDAYPAFFDGTSDLIQNLKVAKLQRILEVSYQTEAELEAHLDSPSELKTSIEAEFQNKLKEASRKKAERSIQLQAEMNHINKQRRVMEGVLTWDMVQLSVKRACKLHKIKVELDSRDKLHKIQRGLDRKEPETREFLLSTMPDDPGMDDLRKALRAAPKDSFGTKQKKELQHFQVDNAFLSAEVKVLQERILSIKEEAKKLEWVDATLLKLDTKKLKKLKTRYQKKIGVTF
jgi:hypothetical protein